MTSLYTLPGRYASATSDCESQSTSSPFGMNRISMLVIDGPMQTILTRNGRSNSAMILLNANRVSMRMYNVEQRYGAA